MEKDKIKLQAEVGRWHMEHEASVEKKNGHEDVSHSEDNPEPC